MRAAPSLSFYLNSKYIYHAYYVHNSAPPQFQSLKSSSPSRSFPGSECPSASAHFNVPQPLTLQ